MLPGLIDCHTHLMLGFGDDLDERYPEPPLYQTLKCAPHLRQDIRAGITTILNPSEASCRTAAVRHAVERGLIPGPRILAGMRRIRPTHGRRQNACGFDGVESLRQAREVRALLEAALRKLGKGLP